MITGPASKEQLKEWHAVHALFKDKLKPNRKSGREVLEFIKNKYPLEEVNDEMYLKVVADNVSSSDFLKKRLPNGLEVRPVAFIVKNEGLGKALYDNCEEIWDDCPVFVGIDLTTGYVHIEGSCALYDEIFAFQGIDEFDLENCVRVADYVNCIKKFDKDFYDSLSA